MFIVSASIIYGSLLFALFSEYANSFSHVVFLCTKLPSSYHKTGRINPPLERCRMSLSSLKEI